MGELARESSPRFTPEGLIEALTIYECRKHGWREFPQKTYDSRGHSYAICDRCGLALTAAEVERVNG